VAEETGLILPLGEWVLGEACRQRYGWQERRPYLPPSLVSANVSLKQFLQTDLVEKVAKVLRETRLRAEGLSLEVPENALMEDAETAVGKLGALKDLGVHVVIDDFGTGSSSLSRLQRLPLYLLRSAAP